MIRCLATVLSSVVVTSLVSCNSDPKSTATKGAEPHKDDFARQFRHHERPWPTNMTTIADTKLGVQFDSSMDAGFGIQVLFRGQPSGHVEDVLFRSIAFKPGDMLWLEVSEGLTDGKRIFKFEFKELALRHTFWTAAYEFPSDLEYSVVPLRTHLMLDKDRVEYWHLCIGKDCKPRTGEAPEAMSRRVEYAVILNAAEIKKFKN